MTEYSERYVSSQRGTLVHLRATYGELSSGNRISLKQIISQLFDLLMEIEHSGNSCEITVRAAVLPKWSNQPTYSSSSVSVDAPLSYFETPSLEVNPDSAP